MSPFQLLLPLKLRRQPRSLPHRHRRSNTVHSTDRSDFTTIDSRGCRRILHRPARKSRRHIRSRSVARADRPQPRCRTYTLGPTEINIRRAKMPLFNRSSAAPGVVQDSFGQEHVRGEHANLTYRVNGVLLPQPINGFGQELDTRLIDSVTLITGSLPAQFGFHTAGIVDVQTKSGDTLDHNELSLVRRQLRHVQSFGPSRRHAPASSITSSPARTTTTTWASKIPPTATIRFTITPTRKGSSAISPIASTTPADSAC